MAVVAEPLAGSAQCLLVNCLNQGQSSYSRDPSTQIHVYTWRSIHDDRRAYGAADERFCCYRPMQYGECSLHIPKFFYNMWSEKCERFNYSGCGTNGNIFSTEEECKRLCGDVKVVLSFVILSILLLILIAIIVQRCTLFWHPPSIRKPLLSDPDGQEELVAVDGSPEVDWARSSPGPRRRLKGRRVIKG